MIILRKKEGNDNDEELAAFQKHALYFFQTWINLYEKNSITNYIRIIGVGHFIEYMKRYGNLSKYSQQGWEALNALIWLFFFRWTNKGGRKSGDVLTNLKSKLVPIGRLVQRRLLWVCNLFPPTFWDNDYILLTFNSSTCDNDDEDIILDTGIMLDT